MSYPRGRRDDYRYNENNGVILHPTQADETNEKTRLQQPVKLQPSWEENNLPEDELNFKNLTMDDANLQLNTPPDKYNLVYMTFLIHGIGILLPWNMFITAKKYFDEYKLAQSYIGYVFPYVASFMQYITFASQVPNVVFNWMNIYVKLGGNLTTRIVWSIIVEVIVFIITVILAMVDSSQWPHAFFWLTMVCVVILNMANGMYQNTIYGMAAKLPGKYTGAVILGSNTSGTFTAVVGIATNLLTSNVRMAAIYYFITALFVLLICFDTYFALPLNRFYRHYELKEQKEEEARRRQRAGVKEAVPYTYILKKAMPQFYNVFMLFFVTLAIFPAIHSAVRRSDENFFIGDKVYTDVTCFLTFNITAMLGSILPSFVMWPSPKYLWIPITLRLFYIPLYLFSNYHPPGEGLKRILPVLITNDWVYWIMAITFGLTSGYFSSLAMMYAPRYVEERHQGSAGMFAAAFLITGIFCGILVSFIWPALVQHVGN